MVISRFCVVRFFSDNLYMIFNGANGQVHFTDRETGLFLHRQKGEISASKLDILLDRGLVYKCIEDEEKAYQKLVEDEKKQRAQKQPDSLSISVNPTQDCNLACPYCDTRSTFQRKSRARLKVADVDQIFSAVSTVEKKWGKKFNGSITLFGGEPLMAENLDFVEALFTHAAEHRYNISIITNGVALDTYRDLLAIHRDLINEVQITLDGPRSTHDQRRIGPSFPRTFDLIVQSIEFMLSLGVRVIVRTNLDKSNFNKFRTLLRFISRRGWPEKDNFVFDPALVHPNDAYATRKMYMNRAQFTAKLAKFVQKNLAEFPFLRNLVTNYELTSACFHPVLWSLGKIDEKYSCQISPPSFATMGCGSQNNDALTFAADGGIYTCFGAVGETDLKVGVFKPEFSIDQKSWERNNARYSYNIPKCRLCALQKYCGGGCVYNASRANQDIYEPASAECERLKTDFVEYLDMYSHDFAVKAMSDAISSRKK